MMITKIAFLKIVFNKSIKKVLNLIFKKNKKFLKNKKNHLIIN